MEKFACEFAGCDVGGGDVFGFKVLPIDGVWPSEIDLGDVDLETQFGQFFCQKITAAMTSND